MSTVVFRSDSPYVPRAIEPRRATAVVMAPDAGLTLRVLVLSNSDPKIVEGNYVSELTRALADLGHHADVASGAPYPELDPRVGLITLPPMMPGFSPSFLPRGLRAAAKKAVGSYLFSERLLRAMRQQRGRYDLVIDNGTLGPAVHRLKRLGLPVVSIVHEPSVLGDRVRKKVLAELDGVIVSSQGTPETLARDHDIEISKIAIIPRGTAARGERVARLISKFYQDSIRGGA